MAARNRKHRELIFELGIDPSLETLQQELKTIRFWKVLVFWGYYVWATLSMISWCWKPIPYCLSRLLSLSNLPLLPKLSFPDCCLEFIPDPCLTLTTHSPLEHLFIFAALEVVRGLFGIIHQLLILVCHLGPLKSSNTPRICPLL